MSSEQSSPAIAFENVSKQYRLGARSPGPLGALEAGIQRLVCGRTGSVAPLSALSEVSFEVFRGEVLGIIGQNGAGKTTVLKLLAGVTRPTTGRAYVNGRLSALIELGAGFHPELTGRENIYLNGAILGLKRRQIDAIMNDIIEFSGLLPFMETPVKRYSSGMYARLGFSVAVFVDPDVLLVDEVLSVGDMVFQQKSLKRMLEFRAQAKAMVFVSHNLLAVQQLCSRVLWLDRGRIMEIGDPAHVLDQYRRASARTHVPNGGPPRDTEGTDVPAIKVLDVVLRDRQHDLATEFNVLDSLGVEISLEVREPVANLVAGVALYSSTGVKLGEATNALDGFQVDHTRGRGRLEFVLPSLPVTPGSYYINIGISDGYLMSIDHFPYAAQFSVCGNPTQSMSPGPVFLSGEWSYQQQGRP